MGAIFSSIIAHSDACGARSSETNLGDLPESCVASVLEYMDPQEICKVAVLNRAFRGASSADFVWESKLPSNYESLIDKLFDEFPSNLCKRDIYYCLCRSNSFDGGTKKAWLDKKFGKICLLISSNGLAITGIDDRRYWNRIPTMESRFQSIAYLQQTWWFEVKGEVEFPFPAGSYSLFFRLHLGKSIKRFCRRVCDPEHVHGWDIKPVQFQVSTSDGQHATSQCYLREPGSWILYHGGDFIVENPTVPTKVKFSMTQIDCTHTKGGLCVDSVLIYPGELKKMVAGPTGVHHEDQKLIYKDKERNSRSFLDVCGVKNNSKIVLIEDLVSREKRFIELMKNTKMDKASKEISEITLEVDKYAKQVANLDSQIFSGKRVVEKVLLNLIEQLMTLLIKLDGIVADGDVKSRRRLQVKRVQKYIETLDMLKIKNSMINSVEQLIPMQQQQQQHPKIVKEKLSKISNQNNHQEQQKSRIHPKNTLNGVMMQQQQQQPQPVVVTTNWETFDSGSSSKPQFSISGSATGHSDNNTASSKQSWEYFL